MDKLYPHTQIIDDNAIGHDAFVKGALWMQEQYKVDEEELNELAEQVNPYPPYDKSDMCVAHSHDGFNEGFIEGYYLALKQIKL